MPLIAPTAAWTMATSLSGVASAPDDNGLYFSHRGRTEMLEEPLIPFLRMGNSVSRFFSPS